IEKHGAPAEVLGVKAQACVRRYVSKRAVPIVVIKRRGVVGKVGFEDVEAAVAVVVADGRAHASLLAAVFVERCASDYGHVGKCSVVVVVVENAGRAVAGYINIGPAIVVIIER